MKASDSSSPLPAGEDWRQGKSGIAWSGLGTLFGLTLRQQLHGKRLLILALLHLLPIAIAILVRNVPHPPSAGDLEFALIFTMIPHVLVPLTALLFASGVIQDEIEEQTLTYLLVRPLPRWALYVTKLLATLLVTTAMATLFTVATYAAIYLGETEPGFALVVSRALRVSVLLALSLIAYCALFGCLSFYVRRTLVIGVAYIALFEGLLANMDFVVRRLTVMYYFRVLSVRWLEPANTQTWRLDLSTAPTAAGCVLTLLIVSLLATLLATYAMCTREFRVKTPEGS
jgi:ABC-2 type transport system permease protein